MALEDLKPSGWLRVVNSDSSVADKAKECHGATKHGLVILKDFRFTKVEKNIFVCHFIDVKNLKPLNELEKYIQ